MKSWSLACIGLLLLLVVDFGRAVGNSTQMITGNCWPQVLRLAVVSVGGVCLGLSRRVFWFALICLRCALCSVKGDELVLLQVDVVAISFSSLGDLPLHPAMVRESLAIGFSRFEAVEGGLVNLLDLLVCLLSSLHGLLRHSNVVTGQDGGLQNLQ